MIELHHQVIFQRDLFQITYLYLQVPYIENNIHITTTDAFGENITGELTATINSEQIAIQDNMFKYTTKTTGNMILTVTYTDSNGKYNTTTITKTLTVTPLTLTINPITASIGDTINISVRITADNTTITTINKGKITFKVDSKTLKDINCKVIYAKVINGTATIENYMVPDIWNKHSTIQAIYAGSSYMAKLSSEKTEIIMNLPETSITNSDITATAGQTVTLTATINDNTINTGKIVFKVNGKSIKDVNGKVIYVKVVNGHVSVEYTIPTDMKAKDYNLTAVFISSE